MNKKLGFTLLFLFVAFFILNYLYPFTSDDYKFTRIPLDHYRNSIRSIKDCVISTSIFYQGWNGRVVSNFLGFLLCGLYNKWLYSIISSFVIVSVIYLSVKLSNSKFNDYRYLIFCALLFMVGIPEINQVLFWKIGALNYVFSSLSMVLIYYIFFYDANCFNKNIFTIAFLIISCLVGSLQNEAVSLPLSGVLILYYIFNLKQIRSTQKIIVVTFFVGTLFNVLCPGTFVRLNVDTDSNKIFSILKFWGSEVLYGKFFVADVILLVILTITKQVKLFIKKDKYLLLFLLIHFSFLLLLAVKGTSITGRVLFFQEIIAYIVFLKGLLYLMPKVFKYKYLYVSSAIILLLIFSFKVNTFNILRKEVSQELEYMKCEKDSIVRIGTLPLSIYREEQDNICFASIYKKKKIIALPPQLYDRLYVNDDFCRSSNTSKYSEQWYQYNSIFIKRFDENNKTRQIKYFSCGKVLKFPIRFSLIQNKLNQSIKYSIEKPAIITTKKGNSYVLVDIGGQMNMKEVKQMIEVY